MPEETEAMQDARREAERLAKLEAERDPDKPQDRCLSAQMYRDWRREQGLAEVVSLKAERWFREAQRKASIASSTPLAPDSSEETTDP